MLDWPNFTSLSGRTGNNLDQHLFCFKKTRRRWIKMIPASRAVTTAGARRFAPSKSILIRLVEFRRTEARHSDTTFETKKISIIAFNEERCCYLIWSNFHSLLDGHVKPATWSNYFLCSHRHYICPYKPGQIAGQNFLPSLLGTKNATKGSERLGTARFKSGEGKLKQSSTFFSCRGSRVEFSDQFLDCHLLSHKVASEYSCRYSRYETRQSHH